jgi:hypothetical protein
MLISCGVLWFLLCFPALIRGVVSSAQSKSIISQQQSQKKRRTKAIKWRKFVFKYEAPHEKFINGLA